MSRGQEQQRAAERRVLQLLHGRATRTHVREIHAHLLRHHLHSSNLLLAHLISVCAALRRVPYARRLFLSHPSPSLPLFNATLKALSLSPAAAPDALHLFSLLCRSLSSDRLSFAPLLKATSFLPTALGRSVHSIHALTLVFGFATHPPVVAPSASAGPPGSLITPSMTTQEKWGKGGRRARGREEAKRGASGRKKKEEKTEKRKGINEK